MGNASFFVRRISVSWGKSWIGGTFHHKGYQKRWQEIVHNFIENVHKEDGCYLPGYRRECGPVMEGGQITCDGKAVLVLLDGLERCIDGTDHAWEGKYGAGLILTLPEPRRAESLRLVFDSDLNRDTWKNQRWYVKRYPMKCNSFLDDEPVSVPGTILRSFEVWTDVGDGTWEKVCEETENYRQLCFSAIKTHAEAGEAGYKGFLGRRECQGVWDGNSTIVVKSAKLLG